MESGGKSLFCRDRNRSVVCAGESDDKELIPPSVDRLFIKTLFETEKSVPRAKRPQKMVMAREEDLMEDLLVLLVCILLSTMTPPSSSSFDGMRSRLDECFATEDTFVGLLMVSSDRQLVTTADTTRTRTAAADCPPLGTIFYWTQKNVSVVRSQLFYFFYEPSFPPRS